MEISAYPGWLSHLQHFLRWADGLKSSCQAIGDLEYKLDRRLPPDRQIATRFRG